MTSVNRNRRIVMLANGHPPFDTRIFVKEASTLARAGYEVKIILPASIQNTVRNNVTVIALSNPSQGWKKLIVNPFNIVRAALKEPRGSVFVIHDSTILLAGVILKLLGRKVIYDAHEDTPLQISYQHWLSPGMRRFYRLFYYQLEKFCGKIFNHIIIAEPVIGKYFAPNKTTLIRNFPIVTYFKTAHVTPYEKREKNLINLGTLTEVRALFEMLKASELAQKNTDFNFVLGGSFSPPSLKEKVLGTYKVQFYEWLNYERVIELLHNSRVGIIITHPIERYKTNYPVKLFEFMAAGLAVIVSQDSEAAKFVKEGDCGIIVDPMDIEEVASAIKWLFDHPAEAEQMGIRGKNLVFEKYNWKMESSAFLRVIDKIN